MYGLSTFICMSTVIKLPRDYNMIAIHFVEVTILTSR